MGADLWREVRKDKNSQTLEERDAREGVDGREGRTYESLSSNDFRAPGAPLSLDDDHSLGDCLLTGNGSGLLGDGGSERGSADRIGGSRSSSRVGNLEVCLLSVEVGKRLAWKQRRNKNQISKEREPGNRAGVSPFSPRASSRITTLTPFFLSFFFSASAPAATGALAPTAPIATPP